MGTIGWLVVLILCIAVAAVVGWVLGARHGAQRYRVALRVAIAQLRSGVSPSPDAANELEELEALGRVVREGWVAKGSEREEGIKETLKRVADYMRDSVAEPLQNGLEGGPRALHERANEVLDAVEDVEFFVAEVSDHLSVRDLTRALVEVTREYTRDYGILVKTHFPSEPVRARLAPEAFKDAIFLILVNAGRYGRGAPIQLALAQEGGDTRIHIRDAGPGFSEEALQRAMDPFFSTEPGALGLGLSHARQVIEGHRGDIWIRNRDEGGGEVEISLPTVH